MSGTELFNKITGLDLEDGSESQLLSQINAYQKDQGLKSGVYEEDEVNLVLHAIYVVNPILGTRFRYLQWNYSPLVT